MTRLLITGAAGVVGSAVSARFLETGFPCVLVERERAEFTPRRAFVRCDLESRAAVERLIEHTEPEIVLHLAGNKDVFALERMPELAWRENVETTQNLVAALRGSETFVIYLSTDYVFDGIGGPYTEASPTRPTTEYGRSKLAAEAWLLESGLRVAIARSAGLFGFPNDFVSVVRDCLTARKPFAAFSDLVSNPTFVEDLFAMLMRLMDVRLIGIFHLCGSEPMSREEFAKKIARAFRLDPSLVHREQRTERIRPSDLSLSNEATCAALEYRPRPLLGILESIRDCHTDTASRGYGQ